jgi:L-aminopeptidase/D-esterase-like protein
LTVGALAAVNAVGSVVVGDGPWFWAAPFEIDGEFGGRGLPDALSPEILEPLMKGAVRESTTLVAIATDAIVTKAQAKRLAVMAHSGLSRAIYPVHSPLDGDIVFAASTGRRPLADPVRDLARLGALAANVAARAIARGVFAARALPGALSGDDLPSWSERFGR